MFEQDNQGVSRPRDEGTSRRTVGVWVQLLAERGGFALLCRIAARDLLALLGARPGGDLARLARHLRFSATAQPGGGVQLAFACNRPKIGVPLAKPIADEDGDWLVGPVALPDFGPEQAALLADYARQGVLPLTWRGVEAQGAPCTVTLPDLLSLRAVVGDDEAILLPGTPMARRRAARAARATAAVAFAVTEVIRRPPPAFDEPGLPLFSELASRPMAPEVQEAGAAPSPPAESGAAVAPPAARARRAAVRVSLGADGRLGLTVPPVDMDALWAGRPASAERRCHLVPSGRDALLLPGDDPLAGHLGSLELVFRQDGPNWYARALLRGRAPAAVEAFARHSPGRAAALRAGRDFAVDAQPGRLVMRGVLPDPAEPPPRPAAADTLARARQLITEGLALVRIARTEASGLGTPEIDLVDECGVTLVSVPAGAAEARIRVAIM